MHQPKSVMDCLCSRCSLSDLILYVQGLLIREAEPERVLGMILFIQSKTAQSGWWLSEEEQEFLGMARDTMKGELE